MDSLQAGPEIIGSRVFGWRSLQDIKGEMSRTRFHPAGCFRCAYCILGGKLCSVLSSFRPSVYSWRSHCQRPISVGSSLITACGSWSVPHFGPEGMSCRDENQLGRYIRFFTSASPTPTEAPPSALPNLGAPPFSNRWSDGLSALPQARVEATFAFKAKRFLYKSEATLIAS